MFEYVGLLAHEQKHEDDFYNVVWGGKGYQAAEDTDKDQLKDTWETAQYGNLSRDWLFAFETSKANLPGAWSDLEADVAAKAACDADLKINIQDWSDAKITLLPVIFFDVDGGPQLQTKDPTHSNNKDHH